MELDQKLGMSLDQLMKSDVDTKQAVRSTRLRGRRPRANSKMEISGETKSVQKSKPARVDAGKKKAVVKKAISKKSADVEMKTEARSGRRRSKAGRKSSEDGIEKIERSSASIKKKTASSTSTSSSRVILTSKKQAADLQKNRATEQPAERRTIKVTNIPYDVHWRDVKDAFARLVPVERCDVEKGSATILFKSRSDAQRAIDTYNGGNMNGRIIKAAFAQ